MKVSEDNLLRSGFTPRELGKIKSNTQRFGDTLNEAIGDLARRFIIATGCISFCLAVFVLLLAFGSSESIFSGGIGLACGAVIAAFSQPPVLAYKAWRYTRSQRV